MIKVERLHGLYIGTLKALEDRRELWAAAVRHAEPVNIDPVCISLADASLPCHRGGGLP
jgi:hypothetical protein